MRSGEVTVVNELLLALEEYVVRLAGVGGGEGDVEPLLKAEFLRKPNKPTRPGWSIDIKGSASALS